MTGRELIIYILENGLEDEQIIQDGMIVMKNLGYIPPLLYKKKGKE